MRCAQRIRIAVTVLTLFTLTGLIAPAHEALAQAAPTFPALAVLSDPTFIPVALNGTGFGAPAADASLEVTSDATTLTIPSTQTCTSMTVHTCIVFWDDDGLAAKLPPTMTKARLRIIRAGVPTESFRAQYYDYSFFATNSGAAQTPGTNPSPLAVTIAPDNRVWLVEEFHREFKVLDPATGQVSRVAVGHPPTGPFAFRLCNDQGQCNEGVTATSGDGEDALVDPYDRVWLNEGGWPGYNGPLPNHARIVMYGPSQSRVYTMPGTNLDMVGMAYEKDYLPGRDRIWYSAREFRVGNPYVPTFVLPSRVGWFDVESTPWNDGTPALPATAACIRTCNDQNFTEQCTTDAECTPRCVDGECLLGAPGECVLDSQCAPTCVAFQCESGRAGGCFTNESCVPTCNLAGVCADAPQRNCSLTADCLYSTRVCGGTDTDPSCWFHEYPIGSPTFMIGHLVLDGAGGLWLADYWGATQLVRLDIATGTVTRYPLGDDPDRGVAWLLGGAPWEIQLAPNGDIVINEYSDLTISRFDHTRASDPACLQLVGGANPCVTAVDVPGPTLGYAQHTIFHDPRANVWFTTNGDVSDPNSRGTVGFVKRDWKAAVLFPPLSLYPFQTDGTNCAASDAFPGTFRAFHGAGIAVNKNNEDVYFADYCRKRLGRLRPVVSNLALAKPATQFGTLCYGGICGPPEVAVDGNVDGAWPNGSVAVTFGTTKPWWQVDLGGSYRIEEVELWNRTDACCSGALQNFNVSISDDPFTSNDPAVIAAQPGVLTIHQDSAPGRRFSAPVNRTGRYVRVQLLGTGVPLQLAEVSVLGGRCSSAANCDDGDPCTTDTCAVATGLCSHGCQVGLVCSPPGNPCGGTCQNSTGPCVCAAQ